MESELDPRQLRADVFAAAAAERRALEPRQLLDRDAFLARQAAARELDAEQLLRALYADLRQAQVVKTFRGATPEQIVASYDLAQKQAVLLRAVDLVAELRCRDAYAYRA